MRNKILSCLLLLAAAVPTEVVSQGEVRVRDSVRALLPPAQPLKPLEFPGFRETRLSNGARLIVIPHHEQPVVSVEVHLTGPGRMAVPVGKEGLPAVTAALLRAGTTTRSRAEIVEATESLGATLTASPSMEGASLVLRAFTRNLDPALDLLADVLLNPAFPAEELEIDRPRRLAGLRNPNPNDIAFNTFTGRIYGDHPYGRVPTEESVRSITRDDVVEFYRDYYRPESALIIVAGAVDASEITQALEARLSGWTGAPPARPDPQEPTLAAEREIVLVHQPGMTQTIQLVGHTLPPAAHPDWPALSVAIHILGGGATSWIRRLLFDEKGFAYSAGAFAAEQRGPGELRIEARVRNAVADSALALLLETGRRLRAEEVAEQDLEIAKAWLVGSYPREMETPAQIANQISRAVLRGRTIGDVQNWPQRIAGVTAADVHRVAKEHLHPERAYIVVVGDATVIGERLARLGRVKVVEAQGRAP